MSNEGYMRENDPAKARDMAEDSDSQHTQAAQMRAEGNNAEANRHDIQANRNERQTAIRYDTEKEIIGLDVAALREKYKEASSIENEYAQSSLRMGHKDYTEDLPFLEMAQRRAVIEKALHEMERAAA